MASPPTRIPPEQFAALPLDQMVGALEDQANRTYNATLGFDSLTGLPNEEPGEAIGNDVIEDAQEQIDPTAIEIASTMLVEAGLLMRATARITPELVDALEQAVEMESPGLYDLRTDVADLVEVITGVANGTIPIIPAAATPQPGGPGPSGGGPVLGGGGPAPGPGGAGGDPTGGLGSLNLGGGGGSPAGSTGGFGPFGTGT